MPGRGRSPTYEEIVCDLRDDGKLEWHKTFVVFAKTSVEGKRIRGRCYTKIVATPITDPEYFEKYGNSIFGAYDLEYLYATHKEVFEDKLRNCDES